jgi:AcrR family transcriptional regulator
MATLAHHVGLVPSAIYRHFKNKEDVIEGILDFIHDGLYGIVGEVDGEGPDTLKCLRDLLRRHVGFIRENSAIHRIVFSEDVYAGAPERKRRLYRLIKGYLDRIGEIIRRGQGAGCIRSDISSETIATMFLGLIQPAALLWQISEGAFDVTKHAEKAWHVFNEAIRAK